MSTQKNKKHTLFNCFPALLAVIAISMPSFAYSEEKASVSKIYIAPDGNDAWSGLVDSPNGTDGPLATLDAARKRVAEMLAKSPDSPIEVLIRGGEYELSETVVFSAADSGTEKAPVTYKAYPNEKPVFTGGKKLSGWKKVSDEPKGIHEKAKGKLWFIDIPSELKGKWQITSLYNGTNMLKRAISEEFKTSENQVVDIYNAQPKDSFKHIYGKVSEPVVFKRELYYENDDLRNWENLSDIEIFTSPKHEWLINYLPLASIDTEAKMATYGIDSTYSLTPGNHYYVENAIDYLDEAGEWVFNSQEGRVYIWPEKPLADSDIRAPCLQEFIRLEGVEDAAWVRHVHFEGLTFRHGLRDTWAAGDIGMQHDWEMFDKGNAVLRFRHAEHCSVKGCVFEATSGTGIRLDLHCQNMAVNDNLLRYVGGPGIVLSGYGAGLKDENKNNVVSNNYLHHIGTIYWHSPAIFISQSGDNLISHNTIHDLHYTGMVISGCRTHEMFMRKELANRREWIGSIRGEEVAPFLEIINDDTLKNWRSKVDVDHFDPILHSRRNRIEYNVFSRVMLTLGDGNALYFSAMGKDNRAEYNYFYDVNRTRGNIRLDDLSGKTWLNYNVGVNCGRFFGVSDGVVLSNNFSIDCSPFYNRFAMEAKFDKTVIYYQNKKGSHAGKIPIDGKKKELPYYPNIGYWSDSIVFDPKGVDDAEIGNDLVPVERRLDKEKAGLLFADPMFDTAAFEQRIFRFKDGSPALELGIEPIDLSTAGSTLAK